MTNSFLEAWMRPKTIKRGAKVSVLVGSVLILINQGPDISEGNYPAIWQIVLTYLVPFLVSSISSALSEVHYSETMNDRRD
jgi:hypothetical protein